MLTPRLRGRLIPLYRRLIADDRHLVEEIRDRLTGALLAEEIAPALVGLTATIERLQAVDTPSSSGSTT